MSRGTPVGTEEWALQSNKGILTFMYARYRLIRPPEHKPMRTQWVNSGERSRVRSGFSRTFRAEGLVRYRELLLSLWPQYLVVS